MKLARFAVFVLTLVSSLALAAQNQNPQIDWVRGTDFSKYHTFTWAKAYYAIQDPYANLALASAVQDHLSGKGFQFVPQDGNFDVFVTYTARINQDPANMSQNILTMNVRIFDAKNNSVVWSAGGFTPIGKDNSENRLKARLLLDQMFQKYPPR